MTTPLRRIAVSVGVAGLLGACGGGEAPSGSTVTIDTLPGGRVVVHNPDPAAPGAGVERWSLRERLRIGSLDGDGPDVFGQIGALELGADGSIVVLDGQAEEVRVFGPDGTHLRTLGGSGEGPGELSNPAGMDLSDDGVVWVMNWRNARYTAYDVTTGEVVAEPRRPVAFAMFPWPGGVDRNGRLIDVGLDSEGEVAVLRLDSTFTPADTLRLPPESDEYRITFSRGGQMIMSTLDPFAPSQAWAAHPDGGVVLGNGEDYRIHRVGFDGDTLVSADVARNRIPVTAAEGDSALAAFRERMEAAAQAPASRDPRVPENKPAHGPLHVDAQGRTWVVVTTPDGYAWDVIDAGGRLVATLERPLGTSYLAPAVRDGRLALVMTEGGVPTVVVYDLVPGGDGG